MWTSFCSVRRLPSVPRSSPMPSKKGKHVFLEKPCAVDPVGARSILKSAKIAEQKRAVGNQRHDPPLAARLHRDLPPRSRRGYRRYRFGTGDPQRRYAVAQKAPTGMERHGVPDAQLAELLLHIGRHAGRTIHPRDRYDVVVPRRQKPQRAIGYGGRQRRVSGDVYDFFSIQYIYDNGMRTNCASRQIDGCDNELSVMVYGTKGSTNCFDTIYNPDGTVAWQYPKPAPEDPDQTWAVKDPYVQEHIRLVTAIRNNEPLNDAETHVQSVLMAIMGRMAAYTGKSVTWDELIASDLKITLDQYEFGPIPGGLNEVVPKPGTDSGNEQA